MINDFSLLYGAFVICLTDGGVFREEKERLRD